MKGTCEWELKDTSTKTGHATSKQAHRGSNTKTLPRPQLGVYGSLFDFFSFRKHMYQKCFIRTHKYGLMMVVGDDNEMIKYICMYALIF